MSKSLRVVSTEEIEIGFDLEPMKRALATLRDLSSVKRIRDQAVAMRTFLKQQGASLEVQLDASELYLWATRRAGSVLASMDNLGQGGDRKSSDSMSLDRLSDMGIGKKQSSRWQGVARVSEDRFTDYITRTRGEGKTPTVSGLLSEERARVRSEAQENAIASVGDNADDFGAVTVCSIEDAYVERGSADLIFTDPPYHDEHVQLYDRLGEFAAHALKPGALCLAYAGKMYLPDIYAALGRHLEYFWTFAVFHPFSTARVNSRSIYENYRPILAFQKPGKATRRWTQDVVRGRREKDHHKWQQDEDAPRAYIDAYSEPGDLVVDPFSGGGTTAAVCKVLGRRFTCFDADERAVKLTLARLSTVSASLTQGEDLGERAAEQ